MTKKRLSASFEIRLPNLFKLCILPNQNDAFSLYKQAPTEILTRNFNYLLRFCMKILMLSRPRWLITEIDSFDQERPLNPGDVLASL